MVGAEQADVFNVGPTFQDTQFLARPDEDGEGVRLVTACTEERARALVDDYGCTYIGDVVHLGRKSAVPFSAPKRRRVSVDAPALAMTPPRTPPRVVTETPPPPPLLPAGQHSRQQLPTPPPPPPPSRVSEQTEQRPSFGDYMEPGLPRLFPTFDLFPRFSIADAIVAMWEKGGTDSHGQRFKDMYLWKKHERAKMNYNSDAVCVRPHQYLAWRALALDAGGDIRDGWGGAITM